MIEPYKYMQLDVSVINIAYEILNILLNKNNEQFNVIYSLVKEKVGSDIKINFDLAVSFLYLLGKIEYDGIMDSLELINQ